MTKRRKPAPEVTVSDSFYDEIYKIKDAWRQSVDWWSPEAEGEKNG